MNILLEDMLKTLACKTLRFKHTSGNNIIPFFHYIASNLVTVHQVLNYVYRIGMQSATRVKPFICTMPMRLDEGWNQIQFNLSDFTRRAYGTNYVETLRVQVHANCRIRRIYFSDRLYSEEELPPEFKLFLPIQVQSFLSNL